MLLYVVLMVILAGLVYVGLRAVRANSGKSATRVIGPDDDPDFLRRLNLGDK